MDTKQGLTDLHDYLQAHGPFRGPSDDLALKIRRGGRHYTGVETRILLSLSRRPEHIEEEKWTVPYVGRGNPYGPYAIYDLTGEAKTMGVGLKLRVRNILDDKRRTAAQADLMVEQTDGRTEVGRIARYIATQEAAIVLNMELMLTRLGAL